MVNKYNILKNLTKKNPTLSQNNILKKFREKGHKIGNEKGREIIREVRSSKIPLTIERDEYIKELLKDDYNLRELGQLIRKKGHKISNEALRRQYKKIRLTDRLEVLKNSYEEGRMQQASYERIKREMERYYSTGKINKLNDLWGRLYDDENNPTFVDS